eukprot:CFRG2728T1
MSKFGKSWTFETQAGLAVALQPNNCFIIPGKAVVLNAIPLLTQGKAVTKDYGRAVAKSIITESAYVTTKSVLQVIAIENLSGRMAHKLMKDITSSAVRKVGRLGSKSSAAGKILGTAAYSSFLGHLAVFVVEEILLHEEIDGKDSASRDKRTLRTQNNAIKLVAAVVLSSVGSAVGTLIRPDPLAGLGSIIGGVIAYTVCDSVLLK